MRLEPVVSTLLAYLLEASISLPRQSSASASEGNEAHFRWMCGGRLIDPQGRTFDGPLDAGAGVIAELFRASQRGLEFYVTHRGVEVLGPARPASFQCETSGSTGPAKRIRRSQASWLASIAVNAARFGIGPGMAVGILGRLHASLPLYGAVEALCLGADLHLMGGVRPDRQLALIRAGETALIWATPTQIRQFAASDPKEPCPSLRILLVGGGTFDAASMAKARNLFPNAEVTQFYGAAETSFIAMSDAQTPKGSVGRAYPGVEIEIRNGKGARLGAGDVGEIWVKSPYLFLDYSVGNGVDTRRDGSYLTIGECGALDANGNLYLEGRRTRMVTIAECNVFLDQVEAAMLACAGVTQAAVLPLQDPLRGNVLIGFVQMQGDGSLDVLRAECLAALGPRATPRAFIPIATWPELGSGKTDHDALRRNMPSDI
ncbi:MAG: AMP-binding protein [Pseudomonadota bacterium]